MFQLEISVFYNRDVTRCSVLKVKITWAFYYERLAFLNKCKSRGSAPPNNVFSKKEIVGGIALVQHSHCASAAGREHESMLQLRL